MHADQHRFFHGALIHQGHVIVVGGYNGPVSHDYRGMHVDNRPSFNVERCKLVDVEMFNCTVVEPELEESRYYPEMFSVVPNYCSK